jgi:hypothetical protein
MEIIEGRYPDGLKARCAGCSKVRLVVEGEMVDVPKAPSAGPARVFLCSDCLKSRAA